MANEFGKNTMWTWRGHQLVARRENANRQNETPQCNHFLDMPVMARRLRARSGNTNQYIQGDWW